MSRPTREEVQDALAAVEYDDEDCGSVVVHTLAAELLALQADLVDAHRNLQLFRDAHEAAELRIVELREELEALRAKE
jgi:hypothetical protein